MWRSSKGRQGPRRASWWATPNGRSSVLSSKNVHSLRCGHWPKLRAISSHSRRYFPCICATFAAVGDAALSRLVIIITEYCTLCSQRNNNNHGGCGSRTNVVGSHMPGVPYNQSEPMDHVQENLPLCCTATCLPRACASIADRGGGCWSTPDISLTRATVADKGTDPRDGRTVSMYIVHRHCTALRCSFRLRHPPPLLLLSVSCALQSSQSVL